MSGHDPCASHCVPAARKILERGDVGREVVHHEDDEIPAPVMRIMSVLNRTLTSSTGSAAAAASAKSKYTRNKLSSANSSIIENKHMVVFLQKIDCILHGVDLLSLFVDFDSQLLDDD